MRAVGFSRETLPFFFFFLFFPSPFLFSSKETREREAAVQDSWRGVSREGGKWGVVGSLDEGVG